eukprot:CAMPEP_0113634408 /NCGR_PEP_ID=MMETSP0017_2-20120614/17915_1 /TAXON_ID=2856 /ORGANISM="Cylindrotheca closterium" /LENGTH=919 /DNA_ID=CAMNT_0000545103 /DNA_START=220 /DNA_END=2979 /DNA_ORIENTATION=- /assembly_acc=CAM_ASM_000147
MTADESSSSTQPKMAESNNNKTAGSAAKRRRNRKKKNKNKKSESQKEAERQKELEFSKMNNHAKLRNDLIQQGFSAQQIDTAMDEMWNQNMPYDEYEQVYKYLKEGKKPAEPKSAPTTTIKKITENDDDGGGVEETKEVDVTDLTPSQVKTPSSSPKRGATNGKKSNLNSMAARLDLVADFDNLPDAIFAMTEWIIKAAKPNELEELCAAVETLSLSKIIRRSITESTSQSEFDSTILPSMVRLLENLLQKCGMPASDNSGSFPSILRQARQVYYMKKSGSEGVPQRVAEFMVARMYVILKESRISSEQNSSSSGFVVVDALVNKSPAKSAKKKGFAQLYSERETHRIVAKQFGAAALASCRVIAASNGGTTSAEATTEAAKTDIFSAIIDEDTNAAFHQHEFMYTELKAQVNEEENKQENHQALVELRTKFESVQTERNGLAAQIAELQLSIAKLEAQDQELVNKQFKIQEEMDQEQGQQSDETKKLNEAFQEASVQLQSDEYVRSLVDLLKDFDDALAERSVQAISQGASPQENASKAMDFYLTRAKNYFESEASLFRLLQKRIVTNQTHVTEMKREIEMCQGLGMTTTINQMEEDIQSKETIVARDKSLVARIRSDSAAMFDELMVWLEEYNTAHDKDPTRLVPISDKIIQEIPPEVSKLEVPNGDRLDAFLAIHDIVSLKAPSFSLEQSERTQEETPQEEAKKEAAPKFTWAMSPTNVAKTKVKKSLLDIQKEEMESKKEEEEKVEEAPEEEVEEKPETKETAKKEEETETPKATEQTPKTTEPEKTSEPEKVVAAKSESDAKPTETKPEEEAPKETPKTAEPEKASEPEKVVAAAESSESEAKPEETKLLGTPTTLPDDYLRMPSRDPLVFPCFLAPPTGTTLSMPFAPFRKEDEGKQIVDLGDYVEEKKKKKG